MRPPSICRCVAFQSCETPLPCSVVGNGNEYTRSPAAFGFQSRPRPLESIFSPFAFGCPERCRAPSRLSKEWFSIITTTMWSKGSASSTVPAGTLGSGSESGLRTGRAKALAARSNGSAAASPAAAAPP